jgi:eukaryotic-like serine/threonine-protein kinase
MPLEQLGPYRITRLLGRGGMGAVYEGVHVESGDRAAVKLLALAHADDVAFRARFAAEVETLKKLRHPNIVQLIGFGEQDGILFYSMELVDGRNLHEELQSGRRYNWREVSDIAVQVCAALKHAHDHGVIHRDLKPANLLTTPQNTIKLTDFGIAKLFGSTQLTSAGGVIGTADYMSPEQAEGLGVTARSDLYSLGGVMYALLVGQPPYPGRTITDVLRRMKTHSPTPLRRLDSSIPEELQDIIEQLLDKDPAARIATPMVLAKRLRAMMHGLSEQTQAASDDVPGAGTQSGGKKDTHVTAELANSQWKDASWDEETRFTEPKPQATAPPTANQPLATHPSTHFTTVDEDTARRGSDATKQRTPVDEHPLARWLSIAGLTGALLAVCLAAWYFSRPPSADSLYVRIENVVTQSQRGHLTEVRQQITEFLQLYAGDPRAAQVRTWQLDYDAYVLWRRLEVDARKRGGAEYMPNVERAFLEAMRTEAVDRDAARQQHQALVDRYAADATLSATERECVDASRHEAARLADATSQD